MNLFNRHAIGTTFRSEGNGRYGYIELKADGWHWSVTLMDERDQGISVERGIGTLAECKRKMPGRCRKGGE